MTRVNEPALHEYCRTRCVLDDVKLLAELDPTGFDTLNACEVVLGHLRETLREWLSGRVKYLVAGRFPRPRCIVIWISVQVNGHEHVGPCILRSLHAGAEGQVEVFLTTRNDVESVTRELVAKFERYSEREVLFLGAARSSS